MEMVLIKKKGPGWPDEFKRHQAPGRKIGTQKTVFETEPRSTIRKPGFFSKQPGKEIRGEYRTRRQSRIYNNTNYGKYLLSYESDDGKKAIIRIVNNIDAPGSQVTLDGHIPKGTRVILTDRIDGAPNPITLEDIKESLKWVPKHDLDRIKEIRMREPTKDCLNSNEECYGQWFKNDEIYLYHQPITWTDGSYKYCEYELSEYELKDMILNDKMYHEIGHSRSCHKKGIERCQVSEEEEQKARIYSENIRIQKGITTNKYYYDNPSKI